MLTASEIYLENAKGQVIGKVSSLDQYQKVLMMRSWQIYHTKHGGRGRAIALLCSAPVFFMGRIVTCNCALEFLTALAKQL